MLPQIALIAVAAFGIDAGWEPLESGGVVYIIQIPPDQLDRLKNTDDLLSDMPKDLDVRQVKITIGTKELPRTYAHRATAKPALAEKELIAEGTIPAMNATADKTSAESQPAGPKLIVPKQPAPEVRLATGDDNVAKPAAAVETTTLRPLDDNLSSRAPEPRDEEELQQVPVRSTRDDRPARDELFTTPPSRPLVTPQLQDPRDVPQRQPARVQPPISSVPVERYTREAEADYEAAKPTLPPSFRTADSGTRMMPESEDRNTRDSEATWGPVVAIFFFLLLSMGANMWLAWIAWEARQRYDVLLEKYRAIGGKPAMELA